MNPTPSGRALLRSHKLFGRIHNSIKDQSSPDVGVGPRQILLKPRRETVGSDSSPQQLFTRVGEKLSLQSDRPIQRLILLLGLSVLSETEAYAVGPSPSPDERDGRPVDHPVDAGTTWTRSFLPTDFLSNVFAAPSGNIWTSGYDGTVLHKTGASSSLQLVSAVSERATKPRAHSTSTFRSPERLEWNAVTVAAATVWYSASRPT